MSRIIVMFLASALVLAVLGLLWLRHENGNLSRSFETANRVASEQKTTIGMLKNQLSVAGQLARRNESAQVALREQLAKASAEASRREQTITRLLNENEAFRRWYGQRCECRDISPQCAGTDYQCAERHCESR